MLFILFVGMMPQQITEALDDKDGFYIRVSTHDSLFNLIRLQAHTKTNSPADM